MPQRLTHVFLCAMLFAAGACSGNVGRYADKHVEDSIAEVKTRNMAPRTMKGEEAKHYADSLLSALMKYSNIDSATLFSTPQGYARMLDSGTTYLRKLTPEEMEENEKRFANGNPLEASGDIIAFTLDGHEVGKAGYKERGKPYVINTTGLPPGTYMLSIPGEKQMKKIVVQ